MTTWPGVEPGEPLAVGPRREFFAYCQGAHAGDRYFEHGTFDMRSAGAPARGGDRAVWLRVVVEDPDYQPACR